MQDVTLDDFPYGLVTAEFTITIYLPVFFRDFTTTYLLHSPLLSVESVLHISIKSIPIIQKQIS